jgi:hypothetical protein
VNTDDIVARLRTILTEKGRLACFLLNPEDIETLKKSPTFDAEMCNPKFQVHGHIWEVAVREGAYPKGFIGYEGFPYKMDEVEPSPVLPWYEEILQGDRDKNIDVALARIDVLLSWQLFEKCDRELRLVDIDKITDSALLLTLLAGARVKGKKLPYWEELVQKVEARLRVLEGDDVEQCMSGLREAADEPTIIEWTVAMRGEKVVLPSQE